MTDSAYTHYVVLVDRSGSMQSIRTDTEGGVRHFVDEQKALPGRATLSLYQFDATNTEGVVTACVDRICDFAPVANVPSYVLVPRGWTPLYDAIGTTVTQTGERLAALHEHERPAKVVVVIATDGEENSSKEWTGERVRDLVLHQQDVYGWQFTYIGANQDAIATGGAVGVKATAAMDYAPTAGGVRSAWSSAASASSGFRVRGTPVSYTDVQRMAARDGQ